MEVVLLEERIYEFNNKYYEYHFIGKENWDPEIIENDLEKTKFKKYYITSWGKDDSPIMLFCKKLNTDEIETLRKIIKKSRKRTHEELLNEEMEKKKNIFTKLNDSEKINYIAKILGII